MNKVKVNIKDLEAALKTLTARATNTDKIEIAVDDRTVTLSCFDNYDNLMEAVLFNDSTMEAKFKYTERLMWMKENKK